MAQRTLIHSARFGMPTQPAATAIAVEGNKIIAVGSDEQIFDLVTPASKIIDAHGAILLPGFYESHMHLFGGSVSLERLNLTEVLGLDQMVVAITEFAASKPNDLMLCCFGANYTIAGDDCRLTRGLLDKIIPDRPLYISSVDYHTAWANSAALEKAGILYGHDLEGEATVVMGEDGVATGELREFDAMALVGRLAKSGGREAVGLTGDEPERVSTQEFEADLETLKCGLDYCARHGITKIINMDGNFYQFDLLQELERRGELICRVELPYVLTSKNTVSELEAANSRMNTDGSTFLNTGRFKLFMDGVFDNWTALVTDEYPDRPGYSGEPLVNSSQFAAFCIEADRLGQQISVHAVGDGAVRAVLDGYEAAQKANGKRDSRHRIEHIDTVHDDDLARLKALDVIASMQPVHPPGSAGLPLEPTLSLMGRERWKNAFAWRRIWDAGIPIAFATDWPVSPLDPLFAMRCALTRTPWSSDLPDQRLELAECLVAYTQNGAFAGFDEAKSGVLRTGMRADLILLQGDLAQLSDESAPLPRCVLTICDGRIIFDETDNL